MMGLHGQHQPDPGSCDTPVPSDMPDSGLKGLLRCAELVQASIDSSTADGEVILRLENVC